ncbi:Yos1-like protein [Neoconidiobolus thromboides FSU 785]|nr:Yos1-like protein [Neoconidiobolus thromboides FSU 785]
MSLSLGNLIYSVILIINGLAILNEERFLARIGLGTNQVGSYNGNESIKSKIINLVSAVRTLMRLPLIVVNVLVIAYSLTIG